MHIINAEMTDRNTVHKCLLSLSTELHTSLFKLGKKINSWTGTVSYSVFGTLG